jgi:hypothetical protein
MRDLAAPITQAFSRVVACTNFGKKNIVGRELVVQFSKKGGWYETWPSTTFATDTAAAGTTGTAGFLPRLVFVQLSARPELGSKKII